MSSLLEIQQRMFEVVSTPLTGSEHIRRQTKNGNSTHAIADKIIKPNDRLTSLERLEIYNRQYWWRLLAGFAEDFAGLRAILGTRKFDRLAQAYLADCPSKSFTLRNLGSKLDSWMRMHPEYSHPKETLALDMARLEWAEIEAFDGAEESPLLPNDLSQLNPNSKFCLQPYLQLLDLQYAVDEFLLAIRRQNDSIDSQASNAFNGNRKQAQIKRPGTPKRAPVFLAVHRSELSVFFKRIEPEAFALLSALRNGEPLSRAVEIAFESSTLSEGEMAERTRAWFESWAGWGWFCRPTS